MAEWAWEWEEVEGEAAAGGLEALVQGRDEAAACPGEAHRLAAAVAAQHEAAPLHLLLPLLVPPPQRVHHRLLAHPHLHRVHLLP